MLHTIEMHRNFNVKIYGLYILVGCRRMMFNLATGTLTKGNYTSRIRLGEYWNFVVREVCHLLAMQCAIR